MRVLIVAAGRLRTGPEAALVDDYLTRFGRTGAPLGLGPAEVAEIDDRSPAGMAARMSRAIPDAARLCVLDERGRALTSPDFAGRLAGWRDDGARVAAFVIGGADGVEAGLRDRADLVLSFGPMVWPHLLARVMLAEQLYRAATILAGGPYHRA